MSELIEKSGSWEESRDRLQNAFAAEAEWLAENSAAYLVGWYTISEWMDAEGKRWICRASSEDTTGWQRQGYLSFALTDEKRQTEDT